MLAATAVSVAAVSVAAVLTDMNVATAVCVSTSRVVGMSLQYNMVPDYNI